MQQILFIPNPSDELSPLKSKAINTLLMLGWKVVSVTSSPGLATTDLKSAYIEQVSGVFVVFENDLIKTEADLDKFRTDNKKTFDKLVKKNGKRGQKHQVRSEIITPDE